MVGLDKRNLRNILFSLRCLESFFLLSAKAPTVDGMKSTPVHNDTSGRSGTKKLIDPSVVVFLIGLQISDILRGIKKRLLIYFINVI